MESQFLIFRFDDIKIYAITTFLKMNLPNMEESMHDSFVNLMNDGTVHFSLRDESLITSRNTFSN